MHIKSSKKESTLLCSSNIQTGTVGAFAAYLFVYRRYLERQDPDNGLGTTKDLSFHAGVDRDSNLPLFTKSFADGFVLLEMLLKRSQSQSVLGVVVVGGM